jgi:hypothetical protein
LRAEGEEIGVVGGMRPGGGMCLGGMETWRVWREVI